MKKFIFSLCIFAICYNLSSAQFNFATGGNLIFDGGSLGIQAKALYQLDDTWRGSGAFTYYLNDFNWGIDLDAHYLLLDVDTDFSLNPLGGLNFIDTGVTTEIGINIGAFIEFTVADDKDIYIEPKFIIGDIGSIVVSAGIKL